MNLSKQETEQFYRIWWKLLIYTNTKYLISLDLMTQLESWKVSQSTVTQIRDKLWADDSLLELFIAENPANLPGEDLAIVASWKHRIAGNFFIFKHLTKYTVFLDDRMPPHAYGVLGLVSPIEEVVGPYLPVMVKAVLLPFKDKITYDSLLNGYNVTFGSGICGNLKFAYRDAKEKEGIITSFAPQARTLTDDQSRKNINDRNDIILKLFSKHLSKSGLSLKMLEQHKRNIELFANEYLMKSNPPQLLLDIEVAFLATYFKKEISDLKNKKSNITSFKRFIRFLHETGRMDPYIYFDLNSFLKDIKEEL